MNTKELTETALMTAVIAVLAPLSIPLAGQVPVSLATFAIMLAGAVLGPGKGCLSAGIYLLLGAIGIPVFAGWTGGVGILFGMTGGFLFGYLPLAFITGWFSGRKKGSTVRMVLGTVLGTAVLYAMGTAWFMGFTNLPLSASLAACVIPFLAGDAIKIAAVTILAPRLWAALKNHH
ncbi:MAG: biotin transporter BioY [Solobacterium sp.]|nr:biotin transporter BioY [Solobacterium sp.]